MAVAEVDERLLRELETMGFPTNRATRALHYSGNCSLDDAVNWVIEHQNDPDIDQIPLVPINIKIGNGDWFSVPEEVKLKAQELWEQHANDKDKKLEENKKLQPEMEKEMIQAFSEANLEEKRMRETERERISSMIRTKKEEEREKEENRRKRSLAQADLEKDDDKRARQRIKTRLQEDKVERRRKLGLPNDNVETMKSTKPNIEKKKEIGKPLISPEQVRDCLRSLMRNNKGENANVKRAFQTLLKIVGNIARNPNEDKFRRIRLNNPIFQERVGKLKGGIEFLEICGFEKIKIGDEFYLLMPRDKMDIIALNLAGVELNSALSNPYFGLLSN